MFFILFSFFVQPALRLITGMHITSQSTFLQNVRSTFESGVDIIQFNNYTLSNRTFLSISRTLSEIMKEYPKISLIIGNHTHIAKQVLSTGIHFDFPFFPQNHVDLKKSQIWGLSIGHACQANYVAPCFDYLSVGSIFLLHEKSKRINIGLEELKQIRRRTDLPIFVTVGINVKHENIDRIMRFAQGIDVVIPRLESVSLGIVKKRLSAFKEIVRKADQSWQ